MERQAKIMDKVTLGSTGITVNKNGFGALPIQRISEGEAAALLIKAYDNGINFFDTARGYTDSEKKIGLSLSGVRKKIYIATKTPAANDHAFWEDIAELSGDFCRGCGYCLPCPAKICIPIAARMSLLMKRSPESFYLGKEARESMAHVEDCTDCGHCKAHCPYGLDASKLVRENWEKFKKIMV